jgi:signal transduction histidine kinase
MSYRKLKFFSILIPTFLIGGFEFMRHGVFLHNLSMETGNYLITILTFIISYAFATWMFRTIERKNQRITTERELGAIYEERERLARELHDSIAQTLFLLKVHLKKRKIEEASSLVNSIDSHLRQAIFNLRINSKENLSFSNRIENWLNGWNTVSGIDVNNEIYITEGYFSPAEEILLFGIIQEAFANIRKHSDANTVFFKLKTGRNEWELIIEDNGTGFDTEENLPNKYGITMLKERAYKLNSTFELESGKNIGTKLLLRGKKQSD